MAVTDAADRTVTFTYDKKHNLASITDPSGIAVERNEYDDDGRLIATIDADGNRTEYDHDVEGRTELITDRLGNKTLYVYDDAGNVLSTTDANGNTTKSTYDSYGNVLTKTDANGNVTKYDYDKNGNLTTVTDASGNCVTNTYDCNNRVTSMKTVDDTEILMDYDENGNLSETTDAEGYTTTYTNDSKGNVTGMADEIGQVMSAKYDQNGNVIETTDSAGNKTVNTFDAAGNRLTQTTYAVTDVEGAETAYYTRGDELLSMERGSEIWYYLYDGHGSTRLLTNEAGRITDEYSYDAYGNLLEKEGDSENEFLYTGEQYNANTGLYYLRARYMNPSTGTFISMDSYQGSIYDPVTLHKYLYANANPVMYTDPSGYFSIGECSIATSIQSTLNSMHQMTGLIKVIKWADAMCTMYDVAMEIRNVILEKGSAVDVMVALIKGVIVGFMVDGMCKTSLGIILKPMMAIFGLSSQVDQIQEAIKSGDPTEIAVRFVQLTCMLFGLTSQCFTGDTLVSTEYGLRPIEDIRAEDCVWSENTETGIKELKKVLAVSETMTNVLVYVTTEDGTTINTTENHPFYVEGKGWCAAVDLEIGDICYTKEGNEAVVISIRAEQLKRPVKVYNLTIDGNHTYFVSQNEVLVHNAGCSNSNYDDYSTKERMGNQKGNAPRDNKKQNKQIDKIARLLDLSKDDRRELHDMITGQGYGYQEILEIAKDMFGGE